MSIYFDGDFTVAQVAGPPEFEVPFPNDPKPYLYKLLYWQFLNAFEEPPLGTAGPLGGTYVGGSAGTIKAIGGGVIEFTRQYALVPDSRSEFESFIYNYQFLWELIGRSGISEIPMLTHSRIQFDYFQTDDPNTIVLPKAPRVVKTEGPYLFLNNALAAISSPTGTEYLGEDATYKIWHGNIYERVQRFIYAIHPNDVFTDALTP
jgi:hypothetical protein